MPNGDLNWIAGFIWNIADDVLRDVYVRGKYRDVILPMTVIRRLDAVLAACQKDADKHGVNLTAKRLKLLRDELTSTHAAAAPVLRRIRKPGKAAADPLHGLFEVEVDGNIRVVEYEPDVSLRDTEQIPLLEEGGIEAFMRREVLPHVPDAWIDPDKTQVGYEISFTRHFYQPQPLRTLLESGDVLVSEGGEVGRACLWKGLLGECYIQNSVHKVSPGDEVRSQFLLYQFFHMGKSGYFKSIVNRVSIAHLPRKKLVTVRFVVPPLQEQDKIITYIEQ